MTDDVCARCDAPSVVGWGQPVEWLCMVHFEAVMREVNAPIREAWARTAPSAEDDD